MTGPEMAALVAGVGILMMTFGVFQIASHACCSTIACGCSSGGAAWWSQQTSVRRARKESRVAFVEHDQQASSARRTTARSSRLS